MNVSKARGLIIALSFLSLLVSLVVKIPILSILLMTGCLLFAILVLYRHMGELCDPPEDHPKNRTLKAATIFNVILLAACVACSVLIKTGIFYLPENGEKYFAATIIAAVILFAGNISPKLPFNRYTGLRLPWTVSDEDTWIVAHRIIRYLSIPLALIYLAGVSCVANFEVLSMVVVLLWIGIPGGLSYWFYRQKRKGIV